MGQICKHCNDKKNYRKDHLPTSIIWKCDGAACIRFCQDCNKTLDRKGHTYQQNEKEVEERKQSLFVKRSVKKTNVSECFNCDHPEPGGGIKCKRCG